jgi:hypothetical protein
MKRICAWCDSQMAEVEPLDDQRTTHGMCDTCFATAKADMESERAKLELVELMAQEHQE